MSDDIPRMTRAEWVAAVRRGEKPGAVMLIDEPVEPPPSEAGRKRPKPKGCGCGKSIAPNSDRG